MSDACRECGAELPGGMRFCPGCGAAVPTPRAMASDERGERGEPEEWTVYGDDPFSTPFEAHDSEATPVVLREHGRGGRLLLLLLLLLLAGGAGYVLHVFLEPRPVTVAEDAPTPVSERSPEATSSAQPQPPALAEPEARSANPEPVPEPEPVPVAMPERDPEPVPVPEPSIATANPEPVPEPVPEPEPVPAPVPAIATANPDPEPEPEPGPELPREPLVSAAPSPAGPRPPLSLVHALAATALDYSLRQARAFAAARANVTTSRDLGWRLSARRPVPERAFAAVDAARAVGLAAASLASGDLSTAELALEAAWRSLPEDGRLTPVLSERVVRAGELVAAAEGHVAATRCREAAALMDELNELSPPLRQGFRRPLRDCQERAERARGFPPRTLE
jgi:outer membrane biosynthesis protein TonB